METHSSLRMGSELGLFNSINLTGLHPNALRQRTSRLDCVSWGRFRPTADCPHVLALQSNSAVNH